MSAVSTNSLISSSFLHRERNWLSIFICIILVALAVPLGDFATLRTDSPPARAAALTVPGGDSWTDCGATAATTAYEYNALGQVTKTSQLHGTQLVTGVTGARR